MVDLLCSNRTSTTNSHFSLLDQKCMFAITLIIWFILYCVCIFVYVCFQCMQFALAGTLFWWKCWLNKLISRKICTSSKMSIEKPPWKIRKWVIVTFFMYWPGSRSLKQSSVTLLLKTFYEFLEYYLMDPKTHSKCRTDPLTLSNFQITQNWSFPSRVQTWF